MVARPKKDKLRDLERRDRERRIRDAVESAKERGARAKRRVHRERKKPKIEDVPAPPPRKRRKKT